MPFLSFTCGRTECQNIKNVAFSNENIYVWTGTTRVVYCLPERTDMRFSVQADFVLTHWEHSAKSA